MQTELNESIINFWDLPIDKINYGEIKRKFSGKDKNEYGNLLHAAVQNKFDEEKVLKFIKILLENGYNVNYKGENTGYNFIQLALYGYTDEEKDYSYSEEFILKLINLAKKYGLDVNTKDNDGDSIVHTAIASEVYLGRVIPILDALGTDFDIECRDNEGHSLKDAFNLYKSEAKSTNKDWFNRLKKEEKELVNRFETGNSTLDDILEQENSIKQELENVIDKIDLEYLIENKSTIFNLKNKLNAILTKKSQLTNKDNEFESIWNKYNELLRKVFQVEINKLKEENNIKKLEQLTNILEEYAFTEKAKVVNELIENYYYHKKVNDLNDKIKTNLTIKNKSEFIKEISTLESKDKEELLLLLNNSEEKLFKSTTDVSNQIELLSRIKVETETPDCNNLTISELKKVLDENKTLLLKKKKEVLIEKRKELEKCIKSILDLEEIGIFENDELWDIIKSTTSKKNKVKIKFEKGGKLVE